MPSPSSGRSTRIACETIWSRATVRVTFYAGRDSTPADIERYLGASAAVMAIESAWWTRVRDCRLYCYHLPAGTFECLDEGAGYFVSRVPVGVRCVEVVEDVIAALLAQGVELRLMPTLWPLRDAIVRSSLQYSMIRLRNAAPP